VSSSLFIGHEESFLKEKKAGLQYFAAKEGRSEKAKETNKSVTGGILRSLLLWNNLKKSYKGKKVFATW